MLESQSKVIDINLYQLLNILGPHRESGTLMDIRVDFPSSFAGVVSIIIHTGEGNKGVRKGKGTLMELLTCKNI